ncbi:glycogen synthase [Desulfosarcina ovata]|uniref:starch synthase n=1 Tax=Desulfosarcina ovata subsp. ovata TaxID=2752305 RepID=A0A5K8AKI6_9BACT|nr:glycogen/starch synthase [Desulfosarcina ovata]BBO93006.1 glycogen synthase [Desulfosarcina ovata subsp. ovata]
MEEKQSINGKSPHATPRILIVTPEVTFAPSGMGPDSLSICARAGGLGDICAAQIHALFERGVDVHLAMPNYRNVFKNSTHPTPALDIPQRPRKLPENRIHLAQDRSFYYHSRLFMDTSWETIRISLAFQREVINRIIPEVQPDLIHCYDWMTGLIPAMAKCVGIPCLFSFYRLDAPHLLLHTIEEQGIDAALFWQNCFFGRMPGSYEETRHSNPVDLLATGVFAAQWVGALSPTYLTSLTQSQSDLAPPVLKGELQRKMQDGRVRAVLPAPDPSFNPATDRALLRPYSPETHFSGKLFNKLQLQETLGLCMDSTVPICFWPTRLDSSRRGCRLMLNCLEEILQRYRHLQIVFVADGDGQSELANRIASLGAADRVAVCDFDARRYRLAYGGSDFVLMPLYLDPCALPCRIGQRYGALPIAFDAGAIHDCTAHLNWETGHGNGFLFRYFDATGFFWAIDQAMAFYRQPKDLRSREVQRIMRDSLEQANSDVTIEHVIELYSRAMDGAPVRFGHSDSDHSLIAA